MTLEEAIKELKARSYSDSEFGFAEFDANMIIQLSDAIEIITECCEGGEK